MRLRLRRFWIPCLLCLGYHGFGGVEPRAETPGEARAQALWEQGQHAMKAGAPDRAIALYQQSLAEDRQRGQNHLSLAAAYLEKGDDRLACAHLGWFLQSHPEHRNGRFYYAELLLKLGRPREAEAQFELAIAFAQVEPELDLKHLVLCHTRLVEVGEVLAENYPVYLHRGIGMYLLARQRAALDSSAGELSTEALLCKATTQLLHAHALQPHEARPCWYLHSAWRQLAQYAPARRWLAEAHADAPFSYLTPAEHRDLLLASRGPFNFAVPIR